VPIFLLKVQLADCMVQTTNSNVLPFPTKW